MSKKLNVSELDFFQVKENLKEFLKNQNEFSDYDFDGAGLNVLLDIMAYSAHYTGVHTNLAFAESFLDSAVQRNSVVSRASELGYVPRSKSAAKAIVRVSFSVTGNPNQYILPKGTRFTASSSGESFTFVTTKDHIFANDGNNVFTKDIELYQGKFTTFTYTVDLNDASQRFLVASENADTRFLTVTHKDNNSTNVTNEYFFVDDLNVGDIDSDTRVYFIKETFDGFFEVYFGDGTIGAALENGNVVELEYLLTDGKDANGAKAFSYSANLSDVSSVSVTTIQSAFGGGNKESTESIKYLAPFYYQSQGRAITNDDYKSLVKSNYSDIDDITAWGGEDNDPPFYGKVFMAIKPKASSFFSNTVKQVIQNDIANRFSVLTIRPEIVNPEYIDVEVDTVVTYNERLYDGTTSNSLENDIKTTIENFFENQTNKFGKPLYYSKLVGEIDDTSNLILNSVTNLTLSKSIEVFTGVSAEYKFNFNNFIHPGSVRSNQFTIDGINYRIMDIPKGPGPHNIGKIAVFRKTNQGDTVFLTRDTGDIDYNTGKITLKNINIDSILNDPINKLLKVSVSPGSFADVENPEVVYTDYNVYTNEREEIIRLKDNGISLTLLPDNSV